MSHKDFIFSLGIMLTNTPASMGNYVMFRNLNQTSRSTRAAVKEALMVQTWTKEYFDRAYEYVKMVKEIGITSDTLSEILQNLKEFLPVLSVQINVFTALANFVKGRASCPYPEFDELMSINIKRHTSINSIDLHIAYCEILVVDSRKKRNLEIVNQKTLVNNINRLIDFMILHRKRSDIRLQTSMSEMLSSKGILSHKNTYRSRWIKFLLDQIANTQGIKSLASIKMLLQACKLGTHSNMRAEIVSFNGIDIILDYTRKDFVLDKSLQRKKENQQIGFEIFLELKHESENTVKIIAKIFQTSFSQETVFSNLMTDDQKDNFHLAQLKNNIYAYWMILNIIKPPFMVNPRFTALQVEIVLDLIERDTNLPKRYYIFLAYYIVYLLAMRNFFLQKSC